MSSARTASPNRIVALETAAWYWLWTGAICLMLVPTAWERSPHWGWLPYWLVGAPLVVLAGVRAMQWMRSRDFA